MYVCMYIYVCVESCSHASAMECDTFGCVIKSRVTRALYIIHAATSLTAALASSPFLFFRVYYPSTNAQSASFFFLPPFFFFLPTHPPFWLHISRTKRAVRKHPRRMLRRKHARQFHRPDKICLRNIYRRHRTVHSRNCSPSSVIKLNFLAACGLGCERLAEF